MDARVIDPILAPHIATGNGRISLAALAWSLLIRTTCVVGLFLANYYSWTMTVTGFVGTKYLPSNEVIGTGEIPFVVAGFIQLGILSFYLSVPNFHRRNLLAAAVASVFCIFLIGITIFFSLFAITSNAQSEGIVGHQVGILNGFGKAMGEIDRSVSSTFTGYLEQLEVLANHSRAGRDRTMIAECGPICVGYVERANGLRRSYGAQLEPNASQVEISSTDLLDGLTSLRAEHTRLSQKIDTFEAFGREESIPTAATVAAFADLSDQMSTFERSLGERNPDSPSLVLHRVIEDLRFAAKGNAEGPVYFAITVACLPDILSIAFTALLIAARPSHNTSAHIKSVVKKPYREAKSYSQWAKAIDALNRAKSKWRMKRRGANIADVVDQSVPDTV